MTHAARLSLVAFSFSGYNINKGKENSMYHDYDHDNLGDKIECEIVDFLEDCYDDYYRRNDARKDYGYNQYEEPFKKFDLYGLFDDYGKRTESSCPDYENDDCCDVNCCECKDDENSCEYEGCSYDHSKDTDLDKYIMNLVLGRFAL